jgi:hypothetical protein
METTAVDMWSSNLDQHVQGEKDGATQANFTKVYFQDISVLKKLSNNVKCYPQATLPSSTAKCFKKSDRQ